MNHFFRVSLQLLLAVPLVATLSAQPMPLPPSQAGQPGQPGPVTMTPPGNFSAPMAGPDDMIGPINMPGDSVDSLLGLLERWTGKAVLRPQNLPDASITLVLKEKVTKREAIQAVETLLNLNGVALTPLGGRFLKATPLALAKSEAPEYIEGSTLELTPSGQIASKLFQLNFLRISEFMPQIAGLLNPAAGSPPVVFEKANAALVTDSISNLQRIETLVVRLDQPTLAGLQPKFYPIHNTKASDVVNKMRALFSGPLQMQIGTATAYSADDRTNQIVLVSDSRQYAFFDELVEKLDVKSDPNTRNEVIPLKHAVAKDVATILSQLVTGQNNASKAAGQDTITRPGQAPTPGMPPNQASNGTPVPTPAAAPVSAATLGLQAESTNQFSSTLTILAEDRTNSIVVSGTIDDMRLIRELIEKLDILLAQVRIEIVVAEVTLSDKATTGIDALGLQVVGSHLVGINGSGSGTTVTGNSTTTSGTTTTSTFAQLLGSGSLSGIVSIATTPRKNNSTIISNPTITTTHNKEAKIFVGETIPTINGTTTSNASTGTAQPFTTSSITQQEVGITITVKPLIGNDGSVQLDLKQEISDVGPPVTIDGNTQNIIFKKTTSSFITAKSGDILVLGGLQRKSNTKSTNRLGPIPIIGDLLGTRTRDMERDELVFFLRPVVLTNTPADNEAALKQIEEFPKKHRREVQEAIGVAPESK